ncbi:MAG: YbjQ family protein [Ignavibacteriae bacterium]|nr:YbjQ family protein [Ignavibacteriota bacterium]
MLYISKYVKGKTLCEECKAKEVNPLDNNAYNSLILTTSPSIEGRCILKYIGIVTSQSVQGLGMFKDFGAGIADAFGGSATGYEKSLEDMQKTVLAKLKRKAHELGANAVISIDLDLGELKGTMLMLTASGTAVLLSEETVDEPINS